MAKKVEITLDDVSIEILKKVEENYRGVLINLGIRLIQKTNLYGTLSGELNLNNLEDMVSLNELNQIDKTSESENSSKIDEKVSTEIPKHKETLTQWGDF